MQIKKINKFKIKLPAKGAFTIDTEDGFPKLHTLMIASALRGSGKSVATANFIRECKAKNYFDRVYLITPTYASNKMIWDIADIQEEDIYEPTVTVLKTIQENVENEKKEYDEYLEKKAKYKQFKKDQQKNRFMRIDPETLLYYYDNDFFLEEEPKWKYKDDSHPPRLCVILDDCMGSDLLARRTAGLTNFCIKHRHIGDGLGISVIMLVQSYCAQGGVARPIRENTTHLMLFKINDENQLKKIKEECDLPVTDEEFTEMCKTAHDIPHNFLFIEFAKKCNKKMFRSGFNNYFLPASLENVRCDCKDCKKV